MPGGLWFSSRQVYFLVQPLPDNWREQTRRKAGAQAVVEALLELGGSAGEMAEYMYRNYFRDDASGEELKSRIHGIITEKYGAEGRVADCVNTKVAWIYWKTEERI